MKFAKYLIFLASGSRAQAPKCQSCYIAVDQSNNTIGIGDQGCFDGDDSYLVECPDESFHCQIGMQIDWTARGFHLYGVTRGCSNKTATENCIWGDSAGILQVVHCQSDCDPKKDGDGCNTGLEAISDQLYFPDGVNSCYGCSYTTDNENNVIGQPDCGEEIAEDGNIQSFECPRYATQSCFHAASIHVNTSEAGEFTDDFRGCSPFIEKRHEFCQSVTIGGIESVNCRDTCDGDNCNTQKIQKHQQCYSCSATRDSDGTSIGVSDDNCFEGLHSGLMLDCSPDESFCVDEMIAVWTTTGRQEIGIKRGCSATQAPEGCPAGENEKIKYKNCFLSCTGDGCNKDLTVGDKFLGEYQETSCYSCKFIRNDNGEVEGNELCPESAPNMTMACPSYASAGCYTGAASHNFEGRIDDRVDEVYKGCSSFVIPDGLEDYNTDVNGLTYAITKTTCQGENCNPEHVPPSSPEIPIKPINGTMCHVCQVTKDQFNNTVGVGQDNCWDGDDQYLQDCDAGSLCITELEIDWFKKGHFSFRLFRGCSDKPADEICTESGSGIAQYKDCSVTCSPVEDGSGCNTGLDGVSAKFDSGNEIECFSCMHTREADGSVSGNEKCSDEDVTGSIDTVQCPKYANQACYTAATWHKENSEDIQEDYKGCSAFSVLPADVTSYCEDYEMNGNTLPYTSCKEICNQSNCNTNTPNKSEPGDGENGNGGNSDIIIKLSLLAILPLFV